jgi:hypothetical protein
VNDQPRYSALQYSATVHVKQGCKAAAQHGVQQVGLGALLVCCVVPNGYAKEPDSCIIIVCTTGEASSG